mmetsp:Transcript_69993/g.193790  ORF Transcript_69993/g.193790 Transcript_69993/m.193790 type:complete len:369 (-) Transcript_69993:33-1139(-)
MSARRVGATSSMRRCASRIVITAAALVLSAPSAAGSGVPAASAAALLLCSFPVAGLLHRSTGSDGDDGDDAAAGAGDAKKSLDMHTVAMNRARDELATASQAEDESAMMAESFYAGQQQLVAQMAAEAAAAASEADMPAIPQTKAAVEQTRRYAIQAQLHAEHAKEMEKEFEKLPEEAAQKALQAVRSMIKREAYQAAEKAASEAQGKADARYKTRVLENTAAAMEPYHKALLRAQRRLVEDEAKARSAAGTSNALQAEARKLADRANQLQLAGLPVQAAQTMTLAHQTAEEGVNLRGWAHKLFAQAEQLQQSIPIINSEIAQAAASAASNVGVEVVPPLPAPPPGVQAGGGQLAGLAPAPAPAPGAR